MDYQISPSTFQLLRHNYNPSKKTLEPAVSKAVPSCMSSVNLRILDLAVEGGGIGGNVVKARILLMVVAVNNSSIFCLLLTTMAITASDS